MNAGKTKGSVFDMLNAVAAAENSDGALKLALSDVQPDPNQPREVYDDKKLANLAKSIKKYGVIQPITVRSTGGTPPYEIITGERRWRASKLAGLAEIPAFVRDDMNDDAETRSVVQLVENSNRADLSDLELAKYIQKLIDESPDPKKHGLKSEIADHLDRPRADISRLLKMLDPKHRPIVEEGVIVSADALSRFSACDEDLQAQLLEDARATGEPITSGMVRAAKAAQKAPPASEAAGTNAAPTTEAGSTAARSDESEEGAGAGAAAGEDGGDDAAPGAGPTGEPTTDTGTSGHGSDATGSFGDESGGQGGDDDHDHDDDDDDGEDGRDDTGGGYVTGGHSGLDPDAGSGRGSAGTGTPRAKAVSLLVTGEVVEAMLRYLVDKASDKLEVRLPNDLAIAVIENLGGTLPDSPEHYAQTIKDLLDRKLAS